MLSPTVSLYKSRSVGMLVLDVGNARHTCQVEVPMEHRDQVDINEVSNLKISVRSTPRTTCMKQRLKHTSIKSPCVGLDKA